MVSMVKNGKDLGETLLSLPEDSYFSKTCSYLQTGFMMKLLKATITAANNAGQQVSNLSVVGKVSSRSSVAKSSHY